MINAGMDFGYCRQMEQCQLRRDANFVGLGMLALIAATQVTYTVGCLLLMAFGVIPREALAVSQLGLGNTPYLLFYMVVYLVAMGLPVALTALIARRTNNPFGPCAHVDAVTWILALLAGIAMCVLANFAASFLMNLLQSVGIQQPEMPDLLMRTPLSLILNVLIFAVLPALLEEMVFRGYVLQALRPYGDGMAVLVSAMLFGLMHGNVLQVPFAFLLGLVLGYFVVQTNNIWLAVVLHFCNNAMSLVLQYIGMFLPSDDAANHVTLLTFAILGIVGLCAVIGLSARRSRLTRQVQAARSTLTRSERAGVLFSAPAFLISVILFVVLLFLSALWGIA